MIYHDGQDDLNNLANVVDDAVALLRRNESDFDCIVVTGMSGVVVGVPVSLALGIPCCILRKSSDDSHAEDRWINRPESATRCLFLDDFVSGGGTRESVREALDGYGAEISAQYLYRDVEYWLADEDGDLLRQSEHP